MSKVLKSLAVGLTVAFLVGGLAYALSPLSNAFGLYAAPARVLIPGFKGIANDVAFSFLTGGGTPAGVYLVAAVDWLFWSIIFGAIFFLWSSHRRARA